MNSSGDSVYCSKFIIRERREALSSHSPWPEREPGTCLPFPGGGGQADWAQTLKPTHDARTTPCYPLRVAFWPVCHLTLSKATALLDSYQEL